MAEAKPKLASHGQATLALGTFQALKRVAGAQLSNPRAAEAVIVDDLRGSQQTYRWSKPDLNPWSRYMAAAFETILVPWLAFACRPERPTRSQGGTDGS